jgi:hypothetical protein
VITDMRAEHFVTHLAERSLDRAELLHDIDAVDALVLEHPQDTIKVPLGTLEAQCNVAPGFRFQVKPVDGTGGRAKWFVMRSGHHWIAGEA